MSRKANVDQAFIRRIAWVLLAPIGSALVPWLVLGVAGADPGGLVMLLVGAAPLIGGLAALSYAFVAPVRMWPLAPYVVAAAAFLFAVLAADDITRGNRMDFGPARAAGVAVVVLAVIGAVVSYVWLPEPEEEYEYEPQS